MSNRFDFGGVSLRASEDRGSARPDSETPFCIAVIGDFSGRSNRHRFEPKTVAECRPRLVDRDNFDEALSKLQPELQLPSEGKTPFVFRFSELDDFHPDRLFANQAFQKLASLRNRVQDSSNFAEVAKELDLVPASARQNEPVRVNPPSPVRLASGSLLDDMIDQTESRMALEPARKNDEVREFARQLAAKYSVSAPDPRQPEVVSAVDQAMSEAMRAVLHHPDFQALEAIWRATFLLVRQLETGAQLKIYLIDVSKQELAADLAPSEDVGKSGIYHLLVENAVGTPGAEPWTLVVGAFKFGCEVEDAAMLSQLSSVAHRAGAVFLAEADSSLLGCPALATAPNPREWNDSNQHNFWKQLRLSPESASAGLALPRFLLRLPYGAETSAVESFAFEEFSGPPSHNAYLWGNPAFALALLLGQSFNEAGWEMRPGTLSQIEHLPIHTYRMEGYSESKPCAEVLLTDEAVERILDQGLIPLVSYKGRDSVRVARFQSVADPKSALGGRWLA